MKILGSDYDGTLNYGGIGEEKINAIRRWREAGNVFALVSGRGAEDVLSLYRKGKFPCDYLLADSGAVILKTDGTVISTTPCDGSLTGPLVEFLFELGCPRVSVQTDFPCMVRPDARALQNENEYTPETMPEVPHFYQVSVALPDFERAAEVTACIRERFGDRLNPLQNGTCIDIVRADMNKAKGLYALMDCLHVSYDDVIAVGDNVNDSDMIREFRSYAMESGVDAIKLLADFTTPGVTELIERELAEQTRAGREPEP